MNNSKKVQISIAVALAVLLLLVAITLITTRSVEVAKNTPATPTPIVRPTLPDYSKLSEPEKLDSYLQRETIANKQDAQIQTNFPWLDQLPIKTDDYFLYFTVRNETFTVLLYAEPTRTEAVKTAVLAEMKNRNIPTTAYKIEYIQR